MAYLKWAGGKRSLLDKLVPLLLPKSSNSIFFDVFGGSGAVSEAMADHYQKIHLNDSNDDVTNAHRLLIHHGENFVNFTERFFVSGSNDRKIYDAYRNLFNGSPYCMQRSALFIYLNRHCFNGLCRFNGKGEFNVPFGSYARDPQCPSYQMMAFHTRLKDKVIVTCLDFETVMVCAGEGDVVYCDPPYYPLSDTANFTSYGTGKFALEDQVRLAEAAKSCKARVVVSNHDTPETRDLYSGAEIVEVSAPGSISCKGNSRERRKEIIAIFNG